MSDTDARMAEILSRYEATLSAIDGATGARQGGAPRAAPEHDEHRERPVLRPADRQLGYQPPVFGR